jgi:hypothetical protein
MPSCLIAGDSIALGLAAVMAASGVPACQQHARVGAATSTIASMVPARHYDLAIVSAGSNDAPGRKLRQALTRLRTRIRANQIVWIYPRAPQQAWAIYAAARSFGDGAIGLARLPSRDGVHPDDYRSAARLVAARLWRPNGNSESVSVQGHRDSTGRINRAATDHRRSRSAKATWPSNRARTIM